MNDWIARLLNDPDLRRMGHGQRLDDLNLGLGWLYYGLARVVRPTNVVVIGSFRGYVPILMGKALQDNLEKGTVYFIDPSLVDDFWKNPAAVEAHFARFDVRNIRHFLMTTQQFVQCDDYRALRSVDIVFVDGYHSAEQARFDFDAFRDRLSPSGMVLFHDSIGAKKSKIYGKENTYQYSVEAYLAELKKDASWQVLDLPFGQGLTLVRPVRNE
ncbi:MAG: class I SAM-dependent methyltransferase [Planctomycetes bacterium]|jgi:predicted O-methyltransferase YrrM|nr:class I SAM-dependent methyltransferase [Planctomycetota bacterium]